ASHCRWDHRRDRMWPLRAAGHRSLSGRRSGRIWSGWQAPWGHQRHIRPVNRYTEKQMASTDTAMHVRPTPALATTYEGGDPAFLESITPLVDTIEVSPDAIAHLDGRGAHLR